MTGIQLGCVLVVQLGLVEHVEVVHYRYPQALGIDEILSLFDLASLPS